VVDAFVDVLCDEEEAPIEKARQGKRDIVVNSNTEDVLSIRKKRIRTNAIATLVGPVRIAMFDGSSFFGLGILKQNE
jgi:hypothetical protein